MLQTLRLDIVEIVGEQFAYRELLREMTLRDLRLRYKQTAMGFGWAIFMPLLNTAVFSVIFTRVATLDTPVPYPLYAYCGLWAWNFLASSLRFSVTSLTSNVNLVSKIYFPREIFPFSTILVCLVDFAVGAIVLVALLGWYGIGVGPSILWLPVVLGVHVAFTAAVGLSIAMANLFYRDVKYLFEIVITVWMFATAVVFPTDRVGGLLGTFLWLNPMTPIIESYRAVLLLGQAPPVGFWLAANLSVLSFLAAWLMFHRGELHFAEAI